MPLRPDPEQHRSVVSYQQKIQVLSALLSRATLMARLGQHYSNDRDIYEALGYDLTLTYSDFAAQYKRQDIAKAIVNKPVEATWRGEFGLLESDDKEETPLEKAWKELDERLKLKSKFIRLDKLASLGKYGVLLLGLDDVGNKTGFMTPVQLGERKLIYVKPLGEGHAQISQWDRNTSSPRYGLPWQYNISIENPGTDPSTQIQVHHARILHVAGELLESEAEGVPELQSVYNRLKDLEKIVGASAEMFWRGARPGYHMKIKPDYQLTADQQDDLQDELDEFEHNLRRIIAMEGVDEMASLASQVADPSAHVNIQIQMISAVTGIPKRILTGSERGELASTQDEKNWLTKIQARREEHAEAQIVRPFVDTCIKYGVLPPAKEKYSVKWTDLFASSDKEKAEVGKARAEALKAYGSMPTNQDIMPPTSFYRYCMGLDEKQIELIQKMQEAAIEEENKDFEKI